ncbi:MAG: type II toxin-antitoxin system VapC family toxin [Balneolaceae bacterium]
MIVVDTNVIASLWVPNDMDELAYKVLKKDPEWIAPLLWRSELLNVMALYFRKEILELSTILQAMQEAEQLMEARAYEVNSTHVLRLVSISACSSYDCEFVALADDLSVQLVTFDKQICSEFSDIATHPKDFIV